MNKIIWGNFRGNVRTYQNFERQKCRGEYGNIYRGEGYDRSRDRNRSRERSFLETLVATETTEVQATVGPDQDKGRVKYRDRIRCYKCREYDHFTKDCPTSMEKRELEQLQQMLNLDDEQTSLKPLVTSTHDNLNRISSEEDLRPGHLNL